MKTTTQENLKNLIEYWEKKAEAADRISKDHHELMIISEANASRLRQCAREAKELIPKPNEHPYTASG